MSDYPTSRPRLVLDFANSKKLDRRITFRRSSSGTYIGSDGFVKTANIDQPRFDHDPSTGQSLGLLIEESRTNIIQGSQVFNSGGWTQDGISLTANAGAAPDGTSTATSIVQGTGNNRTIHFDNSGVTGNKIFTIFAKANVGTSFLLRAIGSVTPNATATINLSIGTISGFTNASIQAFANGWYRIVLPVNILIASGSSTYFQIEGPASSVYIWGAQLEAGSFPTSYIPTAGSTVTRSADVTNMTGTNFSSWYRNGAGTLFAEWMYGSTAGKNNNATLVGTGTNGNNRFMFVPGTSSVPRKYKGIVAWQDFGYARTSGVGEYVNGVPSSFFINYADTSPIYPQNIYLGYGTAASSSLNGTISRITYWPQRLTNSQLIALTRR